VLALGKMSYCRALGVGEGKWVYTHAKTSHEDVDLILSVVASVGHWATTLHAMPPLEGSKKGGGEVVGGEPRVRAHGADQTNESAH
jgi:hypothetical protein